MGFDDLEAAEQDRPDKQDEEPEASEPEPDAATEVPAGSSTPDSTAEETADSEPEDESPEPAVSDTPAFEYDDVKQSPIYARPEAWTALEDALDLDVVRSLRDAGIRNEEKRELHDAVLRVAADHPDEIADAVRQARREE